MAYSDFTLSRVQEELGILTSEGVNLFAEVPPPSRLVDLGGNRSTMSKSETRTRGLSPLFIGRQTHAQVY